jgi:general secretion pathway protein K
MRRRLARQRGAAILMAMLTVTLVAAFAVAALWQQWRSVEVETAERARVQANWVLTGALDWARLILREDMFSGKADHLAEPWAVPLEEARLSTFLAADKDGVADPSDQALQAFLSGRITDLQSRMNVYNLSPPAAKEDIALAYKQFAKLFDLLNLPQAELAALAENLRFASDDSADNRSAAQAPLLPQRLAHLAWYGLSPATLVALEPFVVVLPPAKLGVEKGKPTKLNINTAPEEVLYACIEGMDKAGAKKLVAAREQTFFGKLKDVDKTVDHLSDKLPDTRFDVQTQVFEVLGRLRLEQNVVQERSVVRRDGRQVTVLWRERGALDLPTALGLPVPSR